MNRKNLTPVARRLRRNRTDAENRLWQVIRNRQIENAKFVFQHQIDRYVADFACRSCRLAIELDGGQHVDSAKDAARSEVIEAHGYVVLRFWNNDVLSNLEGAVEEIRRALLIARNE